MCIREIECKCTGNRIMESPLMLIEDRRYLVSISISSLIETDFIVQIKISCIIVLYYRTQHAPTCSLSNPTASQPPLI